MSKKILIGAGIVLSVFIIFLIIICGASAGGNNIPSEPELKKVISNITCEVKDEKPINYDVGLFIDDKEFNPELELKNYTKIKFNKLTNFESLGISFLLKSNQNDSIKLSLYDGNKVLKTTTINAKKDVAEAVNLALENPATIGVENEFYILVETTNNTAFIFDNILFFLAEV